MTSIKVAYQKHKVVFPTGCIPKDGIIQDLRLNIEEFFQNYLNDENVKIPQLLTLDGFMFLEDSKVSDVIDKNSCIVCVDEKGFECRESKFCDFVKPWNELKIYDLKYSLDKSIKIGYHSRNLVYIQFIKGSTKLKFGLISLFDIKNLPKGGSKVILHLNENEIKKEEEEKEEKEEKKPEVEYLVTLIHTKEDKYIIELSLKVASNDIPFINHLYIDINQKNKIKKSDLKIIKSESSKIQIDYEKKLNLCLKQKKIGQTLVYKDQIPLKFHKAEGNCNDLDVILPIKQEKELLNFVTPVQSFTSNGKFKNFFTIPQIQLTNLKKNDNLVIKSTQIHYFEPNQNKWIPLEGSKIGVSYKDRYGGWRFDFFPSNGTTIPKNSNTVVCSQGFLEIQGQGGNDNASRSRTYHKLPQPLLLKTRFEMQDGTYKQIVVEQSNKPINIPTQESLEKSWKLKIDNFISCDRIETNERYYVCVYRYNNSIYFKFSNGSYQMFKKKYFSSLGYKAKLEKKDQMKLAEKKSSDYEIKIIGLCDQENGFCYGVKVSIKVLKENQETEQIILLKDLKIE